MNREQRRDPFLLNQVLEKGGLARLCNVSESEPEEAVVWVPGELLRFLSGSSEDLALDRKARDRNNIASYSARNVSAALVPD